MSVFATLPLIILILGFFLLIKLRFFFILHPIRVLKVLKKGSVGRENLSSLLLALAGTLGVGNIVGVAAGIAAGGSGAVLWLIISAAFSAVIKYAEVTLCTDGKYKNGIIGVIKATFSRTGWGIGLIYTILCLGLCFTMGNALQMRAIAESFTATVHAPAYIIALPVIIAVIFLTAGGGKRITGAVSIIIPLASLVYALLCFAVILPNISRLPSVISDIFASAFTPRGFGGGALGFILSKPVTEGFARGILSNEAGAGTSSLAHATSDKSSAAVGGILGAAEVLFDTVLLCSLTALTILVGTEKYENFSGFSDLCLIFEKSIGSFAGTLIFILTAAFALSTVLCWFYYGKVCISELFKSALANKFYSLLFVLIASFGLFTPSGTLIAVCDGILFFMTVIVAITLIKNCDRIKTLSQQENLF